MPRYHFNIQGGGEYREKTGLQLPDIKAAQLHAVSLTGMLLKAHAAQFLKAADWWVEVSSDFGMILFSIYIAVTEAAIPQPAT